MALNSQLQTRLMTPQKNYSHRGSKSDAVLNATRTEAKSTKNLTIRSNETEKIIYKRINDDYHGQLTNYSGLKNFVFWTSSTKQ